MPVSYNTSPSLYHLPIYDLYLPIDLSSLYPSLYSSVHPSIHPIDSVSLQIPGEHKMSPIGDPWEELHIGSHLGQLWDNLTGNQTRMTNRCISECLHHKGCLLLNEQPNGQHRDVPSYVGSQTPFSLLCLPFVLYLFSGL